jgi:hypothetical protein
MDGKKKIGITGQNGFVGKHLWNTLGLHPDEFETIASKGIGLMTIKNWMRSLVTAMLSFTSRH